MINQLKCFSLLNDDWNHPFVGSIIRIPLRTPSQAERSEISNKATATDDVLSAMDRFATEMGSEGLLFLKSIQKIILEVDHEQRDEINIVHRNESIE
jgi:sacsin